MKPQKHITSVNIGTLRNVAYGTQIVMTGFFKEPVEHSVVIRALGLLGDAQADRSVHGGTQKAVYVYPREHYRTWETVLESELSPGSFGENLTTEGLLEEDLFIGDIIKVGDAVLQVVQPRSPCYKLQVRFGRPDMLALFIREGHPGWYASVLEEGLVRAHDGLELLERQQNFISIAGVWRYSFSEQATTDALDQIAGLPLLPDFWKERVKRAQNRAT